MRVYFTLARVRLLRFVETQMAGAASLLDPERAFPEGHFATASVLGQPLPLVPRSDTMLYPAPEASYLSPPVL